MSSDDRRLLLDGATELEALLLKAAQSDVPDAHSRARTIENIKTASKAAVLVGGGLLGARWFAGWASISKWLVLGGLGIVVTVGVVDRLASHESPLPTSAPPPAHTNQPAPARVEPPTIDPPPSMPVDSLPKVEAVAPRPVMKKPAVPVEEPAPVHESSTPAESIREETAFLETVRHQVEAAHFDEALASLRQYDARWTNGVLAEEAAVLRVKTHVAAGNAREARSAVESFERRYPRSSYLPRVRVLVKEK